MRNAQGKCIGILQEIGNHLKNSLIKNSLTFANLCGLEIGSIKYLDSTQAR